MSPTNGTVESRWLKALMRAEFELGMLRTLMRATKPLLEKGELGRTTRAAMECITAEKERAK